MMHDCVATKSERGAVTSQHWWDDKRLVNGKYEKDEFLERVMDHLADQYDGPLGSDPPTCGFPRVGDDLDKYLSEAANFRGLSVGSAPHEMKTAYGTRRRRIRTRKRPTPLCSRFYRYRSKQLTRPRRT